MRDKAAYDKEWRKANPEKYRACLKRWRDAHPDKVKENNHRQYLRRKELKQQKEADTVRPEITD